MPRPDSLPTILTVDDKDARDVPKDDLIELMKDMATEIQELREENMRLMKLAIWAPRGAAGNA